MFIKNNIKIKQYYRFVKLTLRLLKQELSHTRCKLLCLDEFKAETTEELRTKRFANSTLYILNNSNQSISQEIIKNIYYLLKGEVLNDDITNQIMKEIYIDYDSNSYYKAAKLHLYIRELDINEKEKFAFLLTNLLLLNKEKKIVILYNNSFNEYEQIIKDKDIYRLMLLLIRNRCSNLNDVKETIPSLSTIKNKIRSIKEELKEKYLVEKIYIYGSIACKENTSQSDIDLLIKFKDTLIDEERENIYLLLKTRLQELLKYKKIDFIDFTSGITKMELRVLENIITII